MFCIAAFIIFAILSIFSVSYRSLAASAWHCVIRHISFRPCDINFSEEVKGRIIGKALKHSPGLARFIDRWIDYFATAFVVLSIWSLLYVAVAGLDLFVYGTCNPANVESCTLSGESCGVNQNQLTFVTAVKEGKIATWTVGPFVRFWDALTRVPDRLRSWEPSKYVSPWATYVEPFDPKKPTALEIIDPGCTFCRKLMGNAAEAGIPERYNFTYLLYPIPVNEHYKFQHSLLIASYLEATKLVQLKNNKLPASPDWQLLEMIFGINRVSIELQTKFNIAFTKQEAEAELQKLLTEIGYSKAQVREIATRAASPEVAAMIAREREIVEKEVRTIKIPTLLIGNRRYDRVVSTEILKSYKGSSQ